ncbi:hypothetical protein T484DRAFT_1860413, partial [Baffinella frigidus]
VHAPVSHFVCGGADLMLPGVHAPVSHFVCGGADLMLPGVRVIHSLSEVPGSIPPGTLVAVKEVELESIRKMLV